jgi:hypothetical protein
LKINLLFRDYYHILNNFVLSFFPGYIRLSNLSRSVGRIDDAVQWLKRGDAISPNNMDIQSCLGDIHYSASDYQTTGTIVGSILQKVCICHSCAPRSAAALRNCITAVFLLSLRITQSKDPRSHLVMGNMHRAMAPAATHEAQIKMSYKFFHPVLTMDFKCPYGANGLGIVFAEKQLFDTARDVFSRVSILVIKRFLRIALLTWVLFAIIMQYL